MRSDSKFLQSDKKDKLTKAKGGKLTEVEENDLELEGGMMDDAKKTTWLTAANAAYSAVKETCTGTDTAGAGYAKKTCVKDKSVTI